MSGTVWPALVAGAKAIASEVESKFDWMEGDFIPFTAGTQTDQTYDLGSSSFKWVDGWFSGRIYMGAGAVATPSLAKWDDQNTGAWFPTADTFAISAGGEERFRLSFETEPVFRFRQDLAGTITTLQILNNATGATTTGARLDISIGDTASTGDVYINFNPGGSDQVTTGLDTTDSNAYKITMAGVVGGSNTTFAITQAGIVTKPLQCAFLAYMSGNTSTTGDPTFDTEVFDIQSDFGSSTFTAPVTGKYLLSMNVTYTVATSTAVNIGHQITTSNRTYKTSQKPQASVKLTDHLSVVADMDSGDTASISQHNDGATSRTYQGSSTLETYFSASLIN